MKTAVKKPRRVAKPVQAPVVKRVNRMTVDRAAFAKAFSAVAQAVPKFTKRNRGSVLMNVSVIAANGIAELRACNNETTILRKIECQGECECLIPAKLANSILSRLDGKSLVVSVVDGIAFFSCGDTEFDLAIETEESLPSSIEDFACGFTVGPDALKDLIRKTIFATDVESSRYALGGVSCEFSSEVLTCAATDSRRLAVAECECL